MQAHAKSGILLIPQWGDQNALNSTFLVRQGLHL